MYEVYDFVKVLQTFQGELEAGREHNVQTPSRRPLLWIGSKLFSSIFTIFFMIRNQLDLPIYMTLTQILKK